MAIPDYFTFACRKCGSLVQVATDAGQQIGWRYTPDAVSAAVATDLKNRRVTCRRCRTEYVIRVDTQLFVRPVQVETIDAPDKTTGHRYGYLKCVECGQWVAENWLVRHHKDFCQGGGHDERPDAPGAGL